MTPVVLVLVVANVGIYLLQQTTPDALFRHFALWPLGHGPHVLDGRTCRSRRRVRRDGSVLRSCRTGVCDGTAPLMAAVHEPTPEDRRADASDARS